MDRRELILLAVLVVVAAYILAPFSDAIIFGVVTAYGLKVLMDRLEAFMDRKVAGGFLVFAVFSLLFGTVYVLIVNTSTITTEIFRFAQDFSANVEAVLSAYNLQHMAQYVEVSLDYSVDYIQSQIVVFASNLPRILLNLFTYSVVVYYAYRDGPDIYRTVNDLIERLPQADVRTIKKIEQNVIDLVKNVFVVYGTHSILVGLIAAAGFYFIGMAFLGHPLPFFWFWSIMVVLAAFLRGVASGVFLGPIIAYYFVMGEVWFAFWLGLFSVVFLWIIPETFILPYLGASKINESYLVILLGFTAGVLVFGLKGIVLGPILLITLKRMLEDRLDSLGADG